jgi:hypothetical protein
VAQRILAVWNAKRLGIDLDASPDGDSGPDPEEGDGVRVAEGEDVAVD